MVAMSRTAWIAGGLIARLLMIAFLAMTVQLTVNNQTKFKYEDDFYKLESYSYAFYPVVFLLAGMVLSMAATVASARLRARAANEDADV
ncbi:hypothetical protein HU200_038900 [Digitaria exilis]|uniref:Uncharacterized protein n=1 Tax=Digitaria exilis TaxID=1010633 RepID=A0A835BD05_9POAL|nr:hypothetical protein HU200_038900 [Digitaria exilis]